MTDTEDPYRTVAGFYNNEYYRSAVNVPIAAYHYRDLLSRISVNAGDHVLDIACGTGNWLAVARRRGGYTFGIDIAETALRVCKARLPDAGICCALGEKLPFADRSFDVITCLGSLEHFLDQHTALQEIRRVARDGASIVILVPNAGFLTYRLGLYRGTEQGRIRETIRSIDEWQSLLNTAGLVVTNVWADRHILSRDWIIRGAWYRIPARVLQAAMLLFWPLRWQYQVYFLCRLQS